MADRSSDARSPDRDPLATAAAACDRLGYPRAASALRSGPGRLESDLGELERLRDATSRDVLRVAEESRLWRASQRSRPRPGVNVVVGLTEILQDAMRPRYDDSSSWYGRAETPPGEPGMIVLVAGAYGYEVRRRCSALERERFPDPKWFVEEILAYLEADLIKHHLIPQPKRDSAAWSSRG